MMGMQTESTIYVKGMRKRTESAGIMGMPPPPVTIEQCDLQRTIKINDKKKLYFIEPFNKEPEDVIDEDEKPAPVKNKPAQTTAPKEKTIPQKGGVITMWYNITDTGERKKMFGFTARHIWTFQKIKPSPDACMMKDSMVIKTDGWYIDLPLFNCPVRYRPAKMMTPDTKVETPQPDCIDRYVTRRSGKGKLGFPLIQTTTLIMGNQGNQFETSIETPELTTVKLDSMLFEIPIGYTETKNEDDLQEKIGMGDMIRGIKKMANEYKAPALTEEKKPGMIRIGVYEPKSDEKLQTSSLQQDVVNTLTGGKIEALAIADIEDARKYNCDYTLASEYTKIKQGSKVGGLLKAIKNSDPGAASSYNIDVNLVLVNLSDGSTRLQPKISGKYEGKIDEAVVKPLEEGCLQIVKELRK
jgi:hypothetical protein